MKFKKSTKKRFLAMLLSMAMVFTMLPTAAFAVEPTQGSGASANVLTCEQEEHTHSENCYEKQLICENTVEEHEHTDACYTDDLTCELEEHTHTEDCYKAVEQAPQTPEPAPTCTCESKCIEGAVDNECKVCKNSFDKCEFVTEAPATITAYEKVVALFNALPKVEDLEGKTDEEKTEIFDKASKAMEELEKLSNEDYVKFQEEYSELLVLAMALNDAITGNTAVTLESTKKLRTEQLILNPNSTASQDSIATEGWAWYKEAEEGTAYGNLEANTLVLDGLNLKVADKEFAIQVGGLLNRNHKANVLIKGENTISLTNGGTTKAANVIEIFGKGAHIYGDGILNIELGDITFDGVWTASGFHLFTGTENDSIVEGVTIDVKMGKITETGYSAAFNFERTGTVTVKNCNLTGYAGESRASCFLQAWGNTIIENSTIDSTYGYISGTFGILNVKNSKIDLKEGIVGYGQGYNGNDNTVSIENSTVNMVSTLYTTQYLFGYGIVITNSTITGNTSKSLNWGIRSLGKVINIDNKSKTSLYGKESAIFLDKDGKNVAKLEGDKMFLSATLEGKVVSNKKVEIKDADGNPLDPKIELTPTGDWKSFILSVPNYGNYTLFVDGVQQAYSENNPLFSITADGNPIFTNVKKYVAVPTISITTQPMGKTFKNGDVIDYTLTVAAEAKNTANTISYQWYKNTTNSTVGGEKIDGATSKDYKIPTDLALGNHYYYCVLKATDCDDVTTNIAKVIVKNPVGIISGIVKKGETPVASAKVTLYNLNGTEVADKTATTNASGEYTITDVEHGLYNLKITSGGKENTFPIHINAATVTKNIALPNITGTGNANTVVENTGADTPPTSANLNDLFDKAVVKENYKGITQEDKDKIANGGTVEIKLTAEKKNDSSVGEDANKIKALSKDTDADYFYVDLKVTKTVNSGAPIMLKEVNDLIEITIEIPVEYQKDSLRIFRVHEGIAEELGRGFANKNDFDEYYELSADKSIATLHAKRFSTFALTVNAVTPTPPPTDGGSNGGSNGGGRDDSYSSYDYDYYTITATAGEGGNISTGKYVSVREGDSASFTFTPNKGYVITDVLVNGKSVGALKNYIFTNVYSNQTIHVTFKKSITHVNPQTGIIFENMQENVTLTSSARNALSGEFFDSMKNNFFSGYKIFNFFDKLFKTK